MGNDNRHVNHTRDAHQAALLDDGHLRLTVDVDGTLFRYVPNGGGYWRWRAEGVVALPAGSKVEDAQWDGASATLTIGGVDYFVTHLYDEDLVDEATWRGWQETDRAAGLEPIGEVA